MNMRPRSTPRRMPTPWVLAAGCALLLLTPALAAPTLLDFENLPGGTTVSRQYARQGVLFSSAYLAVDAGARSGTRVLRTVGPRAEVFEPIPLTMTFTRPQARIKLFAGATQAGIGTLRAFDAAGAVIAEDGPRAVPADKFTTAFEVTTGAPRIKRAELRLEGASHFAIDDLEFDGSAATTPPVRVIELRQPPVAGSAAAAGKFPRTWTLGPPPPVPGQKPQEPAGETEERSAIEFAPTVEKELAPGESAELSTRVAGRAGLAAAVRWIGTPTALPVTLSVNGARVASGRSYASGPDRGGFDVGATVESGGEVKLSIANTSNARVTVRLTLGIVRGQR